MATAFFKRAVDPLGLAVSADMGTVFITSGSGVIGHRVAMALLERVPDKKSVRVGVWKGAREMGVDASVGQYVAEELEDKGATVIAFDWTDEEQYTMALAGVKTVFFTLPHMKASVENFSNFVNACKKAGVEHFAMTSFYQPGGKFSGPYDKLLRQCDEVLKKFHVDSRMTYTILHTTHLMSTPLIVLGPILRKEHKYITASYAMGVDYVSPNDVAHAAAVTLLNFKKHRNKIYSITGSHPVNDKDVAKLLSDFYGHDIEHVPIGYHEYFHELKKLEYPELIVEDAASFERGKATGIEEKKSSYSKDLETLIAASSSSKSSDDKDADAKAAPSKDKGSDHDDKDKDKSPPPEKSSSSSFKAESFKDYLANKDTMTLQENPTEVTV